MKELYDQLGVRVPVYALFTKADLIAGFTEFFDDLDRERRGQVWGMTFPLNKTDAGTAGLFGGRVRAAGGAAEPAPARPAAGGAQARAAHADRRLSRRRSPASPRRWPSSCTEAFGGSRLDPAPFLRGVYLTSGTQEGTPIDRLTGAMARSFGIDAQRAPSLRPEQGRSYFLSRLLKDVIFGEAMLVSRDPAQVRRNLIVRAGAAAIALLVALGGAAALVQTRQANQAAIDAVAMPRSPRISRRRRRCRSIRSTDPQLAARSRRCSTWRAPCRSASTPPPPPTQWFPGLSQTGKLGAGAREVYATRCSTCCCRG